MPGPTVGAASLERVRWPVRTPRLVLRRARLDDLEPTFAYRRLPEVNRWLTAGPDDLDAYRETFENGERLTSQLVVELGDEVVGDLMLQVVDGWAQGEVADRAERSEAVAGWCLHPAHTGHGYATEAVRGLLTLAFGPVGVRRVTAGCFAANEASWRLMERVGMRREAEHRAESLHRSGEWLDSLTYALLAAEWDPDRDGVRLIGPGDPPSPVTA